MTIGRKALCKITKALVCQWGTEKEKSAALGAYKRKCPCMADRYKNKRRKILSGKPESRRKFNATFSLAIKGIF